MPASPTRQGGAVRFVTLNLMVAPTQRQTCRESCQEAPQGAVRASSRDPSQNPSNPSVEGRIIPQAVIDNIFCFSHCRGVADRPDGRMPTRPTKANMFGGQAHDGQCVELHRADAKRSMPGTLRSWQSDTLCPAVPRFAPANLILDSSCN
jgi:hypothetical protein